MKLAIRAIHAAGSGHPGGSLSVYPILEWLYFRHMLPQPYDFTDNDRDICILSKGHACPALYSIFYRLGVLTEEEVLSLRKLGAKAQGHPARTWLLEVETSTGSLGQGLAVAAGMALANKSRRVFCVVGDGDMQEGVSIETARFAVAYNLDNLIVVWDKNDKLSDRYSLLYPDIHLQWSAAGWQVFTSTEYQVSKGIPTLLALNTVKGFPVWGIDSDGMHGSVTLSDKDLRQALEKLDG